jgi:hypothetical protein
LKQPNQTGAPVCPFAGGRDARHGINLLYVGVDIFSIPLKKSALIFQNFDKFQPEKQVSCSSKGSVKSMKAPSIQPLSNL